MTSQEFEKYLKSIGGLENGNRAWPNMYHECRTEWLSRIRYYAFAVLHFLRIPDRKNPFRSRIYSRGFFIIGDGWLQLVHDLIEELIVSGWGNEVCQVKEKFAGLRFYCHGADHAIISKYEDLSFETCEKCGQPGKPGGKGWISTLCEKHGENEK